MSDSRDDEEFDDDFVLAQDTDYEPDDGPVDDDERPVFDDEDDKEFPDDERSVFLDDDDDDDE